ncbi:hypothetical protein KY289_008117 [Solanum tuberosum]|nr:hypothetical protein KY289_008117 [Solanum tuberosum]
MEGYQVVARHLKVFGSVCYADVPNAKRGKLDSKAELCVLLAKGYKVNNDRGTVVKNQGGSTSAATLNQQKCDTPSSPIAGTKNNSNVELTTDSPFRRPNH